MARGKTKQRKDQRAAGKISIQSLYDTKHHDSLSNNLHSEEPCNHRNLDSNKMKSVSTLLSKLFTTSFRLALPSLFRGMVQNLQDHVLQEKVLGFLDAGFSPSLIRSMAKDQSTRQGITAQIRMACEEELADVALRISTEDCFDLASNLALRHGRDLDKYGPPCACSFSHCLGCLEKEVNKACTAAALPAPAIQSVDREKLVHTLMDLLESEDSLACELWQLGPGKDSKWIDEIGDAWQDMADVLWEIAAEIEPTKLPQVTEALNALCKLDGLDLWYMICLRELEASSGAAKQGKTTKRANGVLASSMSGEYEKMKRHNDNLRKARITKTGEKSDEHGVGLRKALARAIREQGNASFIKGLYEEASDLYTRAIGYDDEEAVYPLNRAACLIKLSRFREAEIDCNKALELDRINHKAFFRRGVSRANQGDMAGAVDDFKEVLHLQRDDASSFRELRRSTVQILQQASIEQGKGSFTSLQIESLLPTLEEINQEEDEIEDMTDDDYDSNKRSSSDSEASVDVRNVVDNNAQSAPSPFEVFSQVSFAIAFSHIVKQQTGVRIKVPVTWPAFSTVVNGKR